MADGQSHGGCWWIIVVALGIALGLLIFATCG